MQYTKGEWKAAKTVTGAEVGVDDDVIADVYSCHTGIALANAHLIAASPAMLEALYQAKEVMEISEVLYAMKYQCGGEPYLKVIQAIAKAEGK